MFTRVAARTDRLPPAGPFLEVLQAIRRLLTRPEYFRLEREFAGPDFHRGEQCTFSRHTFQHCRARIRWRWSDLGNCRHAFANRKNERCRSTRLANADP
jgi:hypothetical protein